MMPSWDSLGIPPSPLLDESPHSTSYSYCNHPLFPYFPVNSVTSRKSVHRRSIS